MPIHCPVHVTNIRVDGRTDVTSAVYMMNGEVEVTIDSAQGTVKLNVPFERCESLDEARAHGLRQARIFGERVAQGAREELAAIGLSQ